MGVEGVLVEIKKAVKKSVGIKKAQQLVNTEKESIGVTYGMESAKLKLELLIEELELLTKQLEQIEQAMENALNETGVKEIIPAYRVLSSDCSRLLGEIEIPKTEHPRQISRMAGYNLIEDSSGKM